MAEKRKFDASEIGELVIAGAKRAWTEKEPVALIGLLMGAITVAFLWPLVEMGFTAMQGAGSTNPATTEAYVQAMVQDMLDLWPQYLLMMLVSISVMVVLARLATRGRHDALAGGIPAFVTHLMWVIWRFLGMIGWTFLGLMALWLSGVVIGLVLWALLSLFGAGDAASPVGGGLTGLLVIIFIIPTLLGMLLLYGALGLSLISECADHHLSIRSAWKFMKGQRIKMAVALIVVYLGLALVNGILMTLAPKNPAGLNDIRLPLSLLYVITTIAGTFATFIWFSMTAIVAEKIDWSDQDAETGED